MKRVIRPANDAIHSVKESAPPLGGALFDIAEKYGHIQISNLKTWSTKKAASQLS